jgi:hypothetical protein
VWSVDPDTGSITFIPEFGFTADPTPIQYTVKDTVGLESNSATVKADYPDVLLQNTTTLQSTPTTVYVQPVVIVGYVGDEVTVLEIKDYDHSYELPSLYEINYQVHWEPAISPVSLVGELHNQFVTNGTLIYLAGDKFKHTDPSIPLKYEAAQPNGDPLPDFVTFDEKTGQFKFDAEQAKAEGVDSILIRVVASDNRNNQTSATFQTRFDQTNTGNSSQEVSRPTEERNPLRLAGMLEHQFLLQGIGKYSVQNAFEHSNPNEHLRFIATLQDGSPLPGFIRFDSESKTFVFDADAAHAAHVKKLVIKVTVKDTHNNVAVATFDVNFEEPDESGEKLNQEAEPEKSKENQEHTNGKGQDDANLDVNYPEQQQNALADILALLSGSELNVNQPTVDADNHDADTGTIKAKHSLNEQVKQAGFFGYQQSKGQLLADLATLFRKS